MRTDVIDISANQPCGVCSHCVTLNRKPAIDWACLPSSIVAVVVKLTEGADYTDSCSVAHCAAVLQSGRALGGYHYLRIRHNRAQDAAIQATQFLTQWAKRGCTMLPIVDVETALNFPPATQGECQDAASRFVETVEQSVDVSPTIYTSPGEWRSMGLSSLTSLGRCPLWLAEYDSHVRCPPPWLSAVAHQFSGAGSVAGVTGPVDCSELQGDLGAMIMPE